MKSRLFILLYGVVMVLAVIMSSCAHKGVAVIKDTPVHQLDKEARLFYLEALRQQNLGNYTAAYELYACCNEMDPAASEPYYRLSLFEVDMGNDSLGRAYLEKAISINPKNDIYHEMLAQIHIKQTHYDEAIKAYEDLMKNNRSRTDVLGILLQLYEHKKDYKMMLNTIERIEEIEGTSEQFTLAKMQVYQMQGDKDAAFKSLKQLVEEHPNDVNFKVMLGNWLQKNSREDEALDIFLEAQKDEPQNESLDLSLYDHYRAAGLDSIACVYRDRILLNKYTSLATKRTMIQQVIKDNEEHGGDSTKVIALFDQMHEKDPQNSDILRFKLSYYSLKGMPQDEIDEVCRQILEIEPDDANARLDLVLRYWRDEKWDSIIELCLPAVEYNTDEMNFCYFLGLAYYQQNNLDKALEAFRQGVSRINENSAKQLVTEFYALMGDILYEKGNDEEAFEAYDNCLKYDSGNVSCLNNYAYYLSVNNGDLKKAEIMSKKTVDQDPENATFLDTYAWILFLQERFIEAQSYIDRALNCMNADYNNSTIFDHAGDIYKACNEDEKAVGFWKQALEGSDSPDEIKKKIKKNER